MLKKEKELIFFVIICHSCKIIIIGAVWTLFSTLLSVLILTVFSCTGGDIFVIVNQLGNVNFRLKSYLIISLAKGSWLECSVWGVTQFRLQGG